MKAAVLVLFVIATAECRKLVQINKNANVDFINMESGGVGPAPSRPANGPSIANSVPGNPTPAPAKAPAPKTPEPQSPKSPAPGPQSPKSPAPQPSKPVVTPIVTQLPPTQPKPQPNQPDNKPVSKPASSPSGPSGPSGVSTPGYGKVKDLVTFYDGQGKASPIRPYSYSQAVKQG